MTLKQTNGANNIIKFTISDTKEDCGKDDINKCRFEIIVKSSILINLFRIFTNYENQYKKELIYLTQREKEVLKYIAQGKNNTQIAHKLNVSIHTTKMHVHKILEKLSVSDRTEAAVKAIKNDLI